MNVRGRLPFAGRYGGNRGFLLVEALGTLAISALILVGLASILGLMLRAGDRTAARAETMELDGRALAAIERDLRLAARARWAGEDRRRLVFQGGPDTILFARDMKGADGLTTTRLVALQSVPTETGGRLLRAEAPLPLAATSANEAPLGPSEEVYEGRSRIRFAYTGRPVVDGSDIVADVWPTERQLPSAIQIDMVDAATGIARASLRVPLLIEAEPGCAAPEKGFCSLVDPEKDGDGDASADEANSGDASSGGEN